MAVLRCKMCGGDLTVDGEVTVAECEYCGTKQTIPIIDDEKKLKLFERANKLRTNCEFDKAAGVYENIVADYSDEAEGYWGLILCRYGIEYVDDPATGKKIPTCHRSSFESIMDDEDFELVMENSDSVSRAVYREEAKYIEEIRKGIIEVSGKEEPYDIFICYKETDENGDRTLDSVLAQDVYEALTEKGYRVFFSRITLEDKLGIEYEPYIFAALNSAKIMLAFGTSYDFYNAVWVKNEWSRFIKLMAKDKTKHLIPCFKGVDAYDIPKEFAKLQAQDMGKVGAIQDLMHGIDKLIAPEPKVEKVQVPEHVFYNQGGVNGDALLKRGMMALEDQEWKKAIGFFEQVLDRNAENGWAYWGELLAEHQCGDVTALSQKLYNMLKKQVQTVMLDVEVKDYYPEYREKFFVLQIFSEQEIKKLFHYKIDYRSGVASIENIIADNNETFILSESKLYQRAMQYADEDLRTEQAELMRLLNDSLYRYLDAKKSEEEAARAKELKQVQKYFEKLYQCLDTVNKVAEQNARKNEEIYQADLAKWQEESDTFEDRYAKYRAEYEKWRLEYAEPLEQWQKDKAKYAEECKRLDKTIAVWEAKYALNMEKSTVGKLLSGVGGIEKELLQLRNQRRDLVVPKMPSAQKSPIQPILREKPTMSFEQKVNAKEVKAKFNELWSEAQKEKGES